MPTPAPARMMRTAALLSVEKDLFTGTLPCHSREGREPNSQATHATLPRRAPSRQVWIISGHGAESVTRRRFTSGGRHAHHLANDQIPPFTGRPRHDDRHA